MFNPLNFINKIFKSDNEKQLKRLKNLVIKINNKEQEIKKISLNASKLVNADYAGIDLIKDKYGNFKVIEINSIPAWKALQKVTNKNIAYILAKTFVTKLK